MASRPLPKYVSAFRDRHGKTRHRFRRDGSSFYLSANPGTDLFLQEYEHCLRSERPQRQRRPRVPVPLSTQGREYLRLRAWPEKGSYVYFVSDGGGRVKIGTTNSLALRLAKLVTGNPNSLKLLAAALGGKEEERLLHERFVAMRLKGEWFKSCPEITALWQEIKCGTLANLSRLSTAS